MNRRAVFLDKDGTLVENVPYNIDPDRVRLVPGALGALRALHERGFLLVVVTNQAGVARGLFPESALAAVGARLRALLAVADVPLHGFLHCPHHPDGAVAAYRAACGCRKPAPGLLRTAAARLGIDLARSWMVGDTLDDVEAGHRASCRTILVDTGGETEWRPGLEREPHHVVAGLPEAARVILAHDGAADPAGTTRPASGGRARG
jgi:D-glycero-D-manno-heptose 1,7-bisphosphate phosphatase